MTLELAPSRQNNDASNQVGQKLANESYSHVSKSGWGDFYNDGYDAQLQDLSLHCLVAGYLWNHMPIGAFASTLRHPGSVKNFFVYTADRFPGATEQMRTSSALKGLGTAAAVIGADFLLDQTVFKNNYRGPAGDLADYVVSPLIALVPGSWALKGAAMIGVHSLGRALDQRYFKV